MLATSPNDLISALAPVVRQTALDAGAMALGFYQHGAETTARRWYKDRASPVTEADMAVDSFLKRHLSQALPEAGWLSEETADSPARLAKRLAWIVDPIDGTRAFMSGHPDWSISIALLMEGRPVFGLLYAPAHDHLYEASLNGGAVRNKAPIRVSARDGLAKARVAGPKPLVDSLERRVGPLERLPKIPSLALRLARVAEGSVDVALVSSNSCDWDLAAADLILHEAGGLLTDMNGTQVTYNRAEPVHGELVAAASGLHPRVIEAMTAATSRAAPPR
jgi:myo-inositol-1(or 4)-monophosphatase